MESNLTSYLIFSVVALLGTLLFWVFRRQDYFKNHGVPFVKSLPLVGSFYDSLRAKVGFYDQTIVLYNKPEVKDKPFFGIFLFHKPALMVTDPELIKKILIKDFNSFADRYSGSGDHDPLGNYMLFSVKNPLWRSLRGKLSPFFSSGKLKTMYYLIEKISNDLIHYVHKRLGKGNSVELDIKAFSELYTTDVISSCAFGVEAYCLEDSDAEFHKAAHSIFDMTLWRSFELPAWFMLPQVMKFFGFLVFSSYTTKFIKESITHVMGERERTGNRRNDLIDTLIELKNSDIKTNDGEALTMNMLIAQAAVFLSAGFETSSSTQSFALYEISKNEDIQNRLRSEIRDMLVRYEGKVTYDAVMNTSEMPYLDQVFNETLRMYPILPVIERVCINPDGYSFKPLGDFKVPYGMPIYVPTFAIHRDEKNFPDPLTFDPDRFAPENLHNIKPFTFFPFGTGPRNCIGERFALMQVKTGIVKTLIDFRLETTPNTPKEIILEKSAVLIQSQVPLMVNLVKDPLH